MKPITEADVPIIMAQVEEAFAAGFSAASPADPFTAELIRLHARIEAQIAAIDAELSSDAEPTDNTPDHPSYRCALAPLLPMIEPATAAPTVEPARVAPTPRVEPATATYGAYIPQRISYAPSPCTASRAATLTNAAAAALVIGVFGGIAYAIAQLAPAAIAWWLNP